jgi:S1-C subfamily serine protease
MARRSVLVLAALLGLMALFACRQGSSTQGSSSEGSSAAGSSGQVAASQGSGAAQTGQAGAQAPAISSGSFPLQTRVEEIARKYGPSVVNITSNIVGRNVFNQPVPEQGTGSGFVYDKAGHIVTNNHVIANAQSIVVTLEGGKAYPAKVVGTDPSTDLAVISIKTPSVSGPIPLGDSGNLAVGEFVVAMGNPFGLTRTVTFGVISALGRVIQSPDGRFVSQAIQTDAPINPGNSGGPLIDLDGRLIGITSQIVSPSGASAGIGFAIPAALVQKIVPSLIAHGSYPHPYLGVEVIDVSSALVDALKQAGVSLPVDHGVLVVAVTPGSPAARAGIHGANRTVQFLNSQIPVGGDVIVAIDGQSVDNYEQLSLYLENQTKVGQTVEVSLYRGNRETKVKVTLEARPSQSG